MKSFKNVTTICGVLCGFTLLGAVLAKHGHAVPASPFPVKVEQPDGTKIELFLRGTKDYNWYEDAKGYSVVFTRIRYEYALRDAEGKLVPTGLLAGKVQPGPSGMQPAVVPSPAFLTKVKAKSRQAKKPTARPKPIEARQPDGTMVKLKPSGPAYYRWYLDADNFTVVQVPTRYEYAVRGADGKLVSTGLFVGKVNPDEAGLKKKTTPSKQYLKRLAKKRT